MFPTHSARDLSHLISHVGRRVTERVRAALEPEGCDLDEWWVLNLLSEGTGFPMAAVADCVGMRPPALTRLVDRLVANNLVYRRVDLEDRRRVRILLTPRGKSLHRRLSALVERSQTELFESSDDAELLQDLLRRLDATLDGAAGAAPGRPDAEHAPRLLPATGP
jgi:DNA-binding MarR family transcriptional regulator